MANKYLDIETAEPKTEAASPPAASGNKYLGIEAPPVAAPTPEPPKEFIDNIPGLRTIDNIVRRLANGATLGLMDKIAGTNEQDAKFAKESPYLSTGSEIAGSILPGFGASLALGKAIPALGKATLPSIMGNAGISNMGLTATEDLIKEQKVDPLKIASSGVLGAGLAGVLSGAGRILPEFKFRAAGSDLTPADKAGMRGLAATGDRAGIPLRIPELAAEVAPGRAARVEAADNFATGMKEGSILRSNFDQQRIPDISRAIDKVRGITGPAPGTGAPAQEAAEAATKRAEDLVRGSARRYYEKAEGVIVPGKQTHPNIIDTMKEVFKDKTLGPEVAGRNPQSIKVLQHTADALEDQIAGTANKTKQGLLIGQKRGLLSAAEDASEDFATGQAITSGGKSMIEGLDAGPLGKIKRSGDVNTQSKALFNVDSAAEANEARKAIERLTVVDPTVPRGLLASRVDDAARTPLKAGEKIAPTRESEQVIQNVLGDDFAQVKDIITAARARRGAPAPRAENSDSPWGAAWDAMQNATNKGVVARMNDPKNIDKLGDPGTVQRLLNAFGGSAERESLDKIFPDNPLVITVKPKRRDKPASGRKHREA